VEHSEPGANHDISRGVLDDEYRCVRFFGNDLLVICRPRGLSLDSSRVIGAHDLWCAGRKPWSTARSGSSTIDPTRYSLGAILAHAKVLLRPAAAG
jgi:hypothetical protein